MNRIPLTTTALIAAGVFATAAQAQTTRYVAITGSDLGDCVDPADPCRSIERAMFAADSGDVIRIGAGIYTQPFFIQKSLTFVGDHQDTTIIQAHHDPEAAQSRVITIGSASSPRHIRISDLTIRHGRVSGPAIPHNSGGGLWLRDGNQLELERVTFSRNQAANGGGLFVQSQLPVTLTDVTFTDNWASSDLGDSGSGGGMVSSDIAVVELSSVRFIGNRADNHGGGYRAFTGPSAQVRMNGVEFIANSAGDDGGGLYVSGLGSPELVNVLFSGNFARQHGGGMYNLQTIASLTNVTFSGNLIHLTNGAGGALYNRLASSMSLTNVITWQNRIAIDTTSASASIFNEDSTPLIRHSLIANSGGSGNWDDALGIDGGNNLDEDPLFVETPIPPANSPTAEGNLRLTEDSPAIGVGDNQAVAGIDTDLDGKARIFDDTVDLGAYETHFVTLTVNVFGNGTVSVEPEKNIYLWGEPVSLSALPGPDQFFIDWSGDVFTNLNPLEFPIEGDAQIAATFAPVPRIPVTRHVSTSGSNSDNNPCHDSDQPCRTIARAIDEAFAGDTVQIAAGRYFESITIDRTLKLQGELPGSEIWAPQNEFQFARGDDRVISIVGNDLVVEIDSLAIIGGGKVAEGGGLYVDGADLTLNQVSFGQNRSTGRGGGLFSRDSSLLLTNVFFIQNQVEGNAPEGGGLHITGGTHALRNIHFSTNSAIATQGTALGGGMYVSNSSPSLVNVVFCRNEADNGGGLFNDSGAAPSLTNATFALNTATDAGGAISNRGNAAASLRNTVVWGSNAGNAGNEIHSTISASTQLRYSLYSNAPGDIAGSGIFGAEHSLTNHPLYLNAEACNLTLLEDSPAVDAGDPETDPALFPVDGNGVPIDRFGLPRFFGDAIDMGAFEYHPQAGVIFQDRFQARQ